jgi:hypothetical protein
MGLINGVEGCGMQSFFAGQRQVVGSYDHVMKLEVP